MKRKYYLTWLPFYIIIILGFGTDIPNMLVSIGILTAAFLFVFLLTEIFDWFFPDEF